ncbi:hypothetical protein LOK49_LG02G00665 [Camellia lanceoleosa]|uniref:Uncharacterized protein n=1 Tax=Camellia lanceoleosa TaxID=1840588 RepID=A0ACC0IRF7_9ERIC|nr:hypothetical protein LOK49_LG02G00665 [Camellia lanceoleosa]
MMMVLDQLQSLLSIPISFQESRLTAAPELKVLPQALKTLHVAFSKLPINL